jgi:RNA polymerase sigma factor for flagellar operon FliA
MRTAQLSELRERIDEVIKAVRDGEMIEIREGEKAVAELVPSITDSAWSNLMRENPPAAPLTDEIRHQWESYFLDNLPLVDRVAAFVARKYGLTGVDAEHFALEAKLKLIENDYAVLRKFEHKCALSTYLTIVIQRHYLDQKIHEWGKWRPSMRARQAGEAAIFLERLISRDGLEIAEASTIVRQKFTELDAQALERLSASIVVREPRRQATAKRTEEMGEPAAEAFAENELLSEREIAARRASAVLRRELDRLPAEDRLIMKLRFIDAMKVSTMARMLQADQKQLYRRIDRLVSTLRQSLISAGVAMADIGNVLFDDGYTLQTADQGALESRIDELVWEGKARRGTGELPADFLSRPLPRAKKSVLAALLDDRHSD